MSQVIIDNPVINSPFVEPQRHFRFAENGITDEIVPGRRRRRRASRYSISRNCRMVAFPLARRRRANWNWLSV